MVIRENGQTALYFECVCVVIIQVTPLQVYSNFRGGGGEAQLRREVAQSVATNAAANAFSSRV